jgi:CBS domain-containing protein
LLTLLLSHLSSPFQNVAAVRNVEDIMTKSIMLTCSPDTPLDDALEMLVEHHVTGLPVVDANYVCVGVVSDFDLLALEGVSAKEKARGFFPEADTAWDSFFEVQKLVEKNEGKTVADVMTSTPITVTPSTPIEDAANLLLRRKIRRLPVCEDNGKLVGIITRSNIIKAAYDARKAGRHL